MTKRTRYFLSVSSGILLLGLCAGAVAYYGGLAPVAEGQAQTSDLDYIPADATVVAYADLQAVMKSTLWERFRQVEPDSAARRNFEARTGIDLEADIDDVFAGLMPGAGDGQSAIVLLRGRFDEAHLDALARQHGAQVQEYAGRRLLELTDDNRTFAMAFVEPGLAMISDRTLLDLNLDGRDRGQGVTSNDELMTLVRQIEAGHNAWAVGRLDGLADRAELPEQVARQLPSIRHFAVGGRVNDGLSGMIQAYAQDEAAAENLRDELRGFVALAKLQAGGRSTWQAALDSVQLGGTGTNVALSFEIPGEVFELLVPEPRAPSP